MADHFCGLLPYFLIFKYTTLPLTPLFSVSQTVGAATIVTITDDSTGSDVAITQRRVYLQKADGTFLVPDGTTTEYISWAYADDSVDIDALDKDYALEITVQWLNVSNAILYATDGYFGLTSHNEDFDYDLTTMLAANPLLINDNSFRKNKSDLRLFIDSGDNAITRSSDITAAQLCYDQGTAVRIGSEYYFNESTS